ncbi:MAG: spore germination protein [Clostridia bacterium]|nr:spore germination protein [Clostridia bacterium]
MPTDFEQLTQKMQQVLQPENSFDVEERQLLIGDRRATAWFVDAMTKDDVLERLLSHMVTLTAEQLAGITAEQFAKRHVPYTQATPEQDAQTAAVQILAGQTALLIEGFDAYLIIDLRSYPMRTLKEPEEDRVMLGAHDGFCESVKTNIALVRRRIRSTDFRVQHRVVGSKSHTDVAVCWLEGIAKPEDVQLILQKIERIDVGSLSMGHESLSEAMIKPKWFNPFPQFRYTERPDRASAAIAEGKVLVMVDNSPIVSMLPTSLPDFAQDTNEYYFGPNIGTFLRWVRALIILVSLFLIPIWYTAEIYPTDDRWKIFMELMIAELVLDAVKLATLHTPSSMGGMFGIIGTLILGEFAVNSGLFGEGVLLLMAFQAVATFVQPSFPLGYAFKFYRLLLTVLAALLGWWGFAGGVIILLVTAATTKSIGGEGYLAPFIPFRPAQLWRLLSRRRIHKDNS